MQSKASVYSTKIRLTAKIKAMYVKVYVLNVYAPVHICIYAIYSSLL